MRIDSAVVGAGRRLLGLTLVWWGWSQAHKWRWNGTHIDLGPLSIYDIERQWLWRPLAALIWPLRRWYHWRYARPWLRRTFGEEAD